MRLKRTGKNIITNMGFKTHIMLYASNPLATFKIIKEKLELILNQLNSLGVNVENLIITHEWSEKKGEILFLDIVSFSVITKKLDNNYYGDTLLLLIGKEKILINYLNSTNNPFIIDYYKLPLKNGITTVDFGIYDKNYPISKREFESLTKRIKKELPKIVLDFTNKINRVFYDLIN